MFGEGVVNDATSVVLFNAIQKLDVNTVDGWIATRVFVDFLYLFSTSTALGVAVSFSTSKFGCFYLKCVLSLKYKIKA